MERITVKEAKKYISLKKDEDIENASYYTITPSKDGDGWEDVKYFKKNS